MNLSKSLYLRIVGSWRPGRYPRQATRPGARDGWVDEAEHAAANAPGFLRAFIAGARCARRTGLRGYRARAWALAFAWATVPV